MTDLLLPAACLIAGVLIGYLIRLLQYRKRIERMQAHGSIVNQMYTEDRDRFTAEQKANEQLIREQYQLLNECYRIIGDKSKTIAQQEALTTRLESFINLSAKPHDN